jgi:CubicO group peptidase (beta-lactamase class C family)
MARFGLLLLGEGSWNGTPVLNHANYFYQMTHASQDINPAYGYLTWLNGTSSFMLPETQVVFPGMYAPSAPHDMFAAIGRDGQFICIVPSQNLVWIRMGENPEQLDVPLQMVEQVCQYINALPCATSDIPVQHENNITFYPNPTRQELRWKSNIEIDNMRIICTTGETVMDQSINTASSLDISHLTAGLYVCQWHSAGGASGCITFIQE